MALVALRGKEVAVCGQQEVLAWTQGGVGQVTGESRVALGLPQ